MIKLWLKLKHFLAYCFLLYKKCRANGFFHLERTGSVENYRKILMNLNF